MRPYGLDVSADGSIAVVANIGRGQGDNDTVSVIDLQAQPFRVVETVVVGQTPEGIALSPDGKLCAVGVMNGSNKPRESPFYNANGKLLLYRVDGTRLVPAAAAWIGRWSQGIAFSADSRTILVQNMGDKDISGAAVGRLDPAGHRAAHQDQRGPGRHPHRPAPVESARRGSGLTSPTMSECKT